MDTPHSLIRDSAFSGCAPVEHIGKAQGVPLVGRELGRNSLSRVSFFSDNHSTDVTPFASPTLPLVDDRVQPSLAAAIHPVVDDASPSLLKVGTGRLPSLLDTREQPAQNEKRAKQRTDLRAKTKAETIATIDQALRTGTLYGYHLDDFFKEAVFVLNQWGKRLSGCGQVAVHRMCPDDNHHVVTVDCCHVPACPHEEARNSKKWVMRGHQLMKLLRSGIKWNQLKNTLQHHNVKLPSEQPEGDAVLGWKFITLSPKGEGHLIKDIKAAIALRKRFNRYIVRNFGSLAAFIAFEVAPGGHVHLHCLVYAPFIPRNVLQHWLQSQDCKIEGCKHKPGDKKCGGSWVVDIRKATSPNDVLKYVCAPDAKGQDRDDFAQRRLASYLASYKRHRIETYGLAKPGFWKNADLVDTLLERNFCPYCGQEMIIVETASLCGQKYLWTGTATFRGPPGRTQ